MPVLRKPIVLDGGTRRQIADADQVLAPGGFLAGSGSLVERVTVGGSDSRLAMQNSTEPASTTSYGKLWFDSVADRPLYRPAAGGPSLRLTTDQFTALTWAASTELDFSPALPEKKSLAVTGNTTFTTANLGGGRSITLRLLGDTVSRTLAWPSGWTWLSPPPASLAASSVAFLSLIAYGAANADVAAFITVDDGGVNAITWAATSTLDFNPALPELHTIQLAGATDFDTANLTAGRKITVRITGDTVDRAVTWPAGWRWLGATPAVIPANDIALVSLISFGTANTQVAAGITFEGDDPSALVGHRTAWRVVSTTTTLTPDDHTILADASAGAITLTLPNTALMSGYHLTVKKTDSTVNAVNVLSADLIDGVTTHVLTARYQTINVQSYETTWGVF